MKTITASSITTIAIASLFSLTANASNLSGMDYESYVQSAAWPSHTTSVSQTKTEGLSGLDYESFVQSGSFPGSGHTSEQTTVASISDIQKAMETNPTAAGSSRVVNDLLGEDIHAQ